MSSWQDLVTTALLGTERSTVPAVLTPDGPAAGRPGDPAAVLLDRAALLTAARRGGRQPGRVEPLAAAGAETGPVVSRAAGRRLARMLGGDHADLLAEWLVVAAGHGRRVPAQLLPVLLHQARRRPPADFEVQRLVAVTGGARARWLAGLNPEWKFVLAYAPAGEDAWRLGDAGQRHGYLAALRARDPDGARQLAEASWDAAGPGERVMFLGVLADGLSLADEPLLDRALDDRHAVVRQAAAGLLATLPGSALAGRMAGRARECLYLQLGLDGDGLLVSPPLDGDTATRRDGIAPAADGRTSPQASRRLLLLEVIARTPLRTWTDTFGRRPAEILGLSSDFWTPVLFTGWARAAVSQRDHEWMAALVRMALAGGGPDWLLAAGGPAAAAGEALRQLARHVEPALAWPGPAPHAPAAPAVRQAIDTLRFRYQMLKELDDDNGAG